jgi:Bromodomain
MLIDNVKKRERDKLRISQLQKQFAETIYFPIIPIIEPILEKMENLDKDDLFMHLVAKDEAPDYYDVIKQPMSWTVIREKMTDRKYETVAEFEVLHQCDKLMQTDLNLIVDNSVSYNTPDTVYHRTAVRMKRQAVPLIEEAKKVESSLVFCENRAGRTLDMKELEPIEGWEYSVDPWPGRAVRDMSPLSSIGDDDAEQLEKELIAERKEIDADRSLPRKKIRGRGR